MMDQFKSIPGYGDLYRATTTGEIQSFQSGSWRTLKAFKSACYLAVKMPNPNRRNRTRYIHRLVAAAFLGMPSENQTVDHIDGNRFNNRPENLRYCSQSQNSANQKKIRRDCSSQYKGVDWQKRAKTWRVRIMRDGKGFFVGTFRTEVEAAVAYDLMATKVFGGFAKTNFNAGGPAIALFEQKQE